MKFVFCEGKDDLAIIKAVAFSINLHNLQIEPFEGKDKLRNFLRLIQARPEFSRNLVTAFGVIRDADNDGDAAFQCVRDSLLANGFQASAQNGEITANGIKTGILIIGPNNGKGMVEDLCLNSVSANPEFPCVENYFNCISQKTDRKNFSSKAKIRAWMASHPDFDFRLGAAAAAGYWPWENPVFNPLKDFLQKL